MIGGAVVEGVSWQAIFWLNVPVALVALPAAAGRGPRVAAAPGSGSTCAAPLMLGGAVFLGIWGIVHGNDDGWTLRRVLVPLVAAALLVPAYVAWARRRRAVRRAAAAAVRARAASRSRT